MKQLSSDNGDFKNMRNETLDYRIEGESLVWENGRDWYSRPFHCPGSKAIFLAAQRPAWMMRAEHVTKPAHLKLGECIPCVLGDQETPVPLISLPDCVARDFGWSMSYDVRFKQATIHCEFVPLKGISGFICAMSSDRDIPGAQFCWEYGALDQNEAVAVMGEKYEIVCDMVHGFEYAPYLTADVGERMRGIRAAMEHILSLEDGKKRYGGT